VASKIDPTFGVASSLSLEGALQLLEQSGHPLPDRSLAGEDGWLQAVVDGL